MAKQDSLNVNNTESINRIYKKEWDNNKGQVRLHLSFPYINNFYLTPLNETSKNNTGFIGGSVGLDFFYDKNKYVNLSYSFIEDFFLPIAFVDRGDEYELMSSNYIGLSNNHKLNKFSLGYGLSFAKNSWDLRNLSWDENSSTREPMKKTNNVIGFVFSSYYSLSEVFYVGVIYRPTIIRLNITPGLQYEHSISIDFAWKLLLKE